ncbi:MAG TPA: ABC transporter permease [Gammaproteobacteria bacterium]|nr:ABC transporter permease [Gammaproteobacteria bacterium]
MKRVNLPQLARQQGILIAFVIFLAVVAASSDTFLTTGNILQVLRQASILGTMALGVTFVVICGRLDLSVGSALSLTTVLVVDLHDKIGPGPAILVTLVAGLLVGVVNGLLIGYVRLNSLIVTLGMLSTLQGVTLIYTGGKNVSVANPEATWFGFFGRGHFLDIPVPVWIFLGGAAVLGVILARTSYGRQVYAVGGNETASRFSGVNARRIVFSAYLLSGLTTAVAAVIMGSRVMGSQNNVGQGYELQVLAGIILGGTSLLGGSGTLLKTVIGIAILGFIENGLLLLGYPYYVQWLVTWAVIIGAVWLDVASKRGRLFV